MAKNGKNSRLCNKGEYKLFCECEVWCPSKARVI